MESVSSCPIRGGQCASQRSTPGPLVVGAGLTLTEGVGFAIALVSGSAEFFGDDLQKLADVPTSLVAFVGFRISRRPAPPSHPYGYERAEDMAGLGVSSGSRRCPRRRQPCPGRGVWCSRGEEVCGDAHNPAKAALTQSVHRH